MGFFKDLATNFKALTLSPDAFETIQDGSASLYTRLGWQPTDNQVRVAFQRGQAASYGWMYANQPAVRTVVDYIATNVAQLPLKCYERVDDTERKRSEDHPAALTMDYPSQWETGTEFIRRFVKDYLVYDNAFAVKLVGIDNRRTLLRLPPSMVVVMGGRFRPDLYRVYLRDGSFRDIPPEGMIHWYGYNPDDALLGLSKLATLRQELAGDLAIQQTVVSLLKNSLKGGYIKRDLDAPEWSVEAQERFRESWMNQTRDFRTPVLADGMEFVQTTVTPKDAELLSSRQFTEKEVLRMYIGPFVDDENVEDQRKQIYTDVLPPVCKELSCRLDKDLLIGEYGAEDFYFEFDLNEKLRGDLENRFAAITSSVGRAWQTVDEARAREGLPPIPGGDELAVPLNVMLVDENGNAVNPNPTSPQLPAPNVMPPQDPNKPPQDGSYREQPKELTNGHKALEVTTIPRKVGDIARQRGYISEAQDVLEKFYRRQLRTVKSSKAFDSNRWNRELAADLGTLISSIVAREANIYKARLGAGEFDMEQVRHYLAGMASSMAEKMNAATQADLEGDRTAREALERAVSERAAVAAAGVGTRAAVVARQEAAKQSPHHERRLQTWIADTDRHADLDGVSVPLDSDWGGIEPGSEPNCSCTASIG